jgi:hypothetical protein
VRLTRRDALDKAATLGAAAWLDARGRGLRIAGRLADALREGLASEEVRTFFEAPGAVYRSIPRPEGPLSLERIGEHVLAILGDARGIDGESYMRLLEEVRAAFTG